MFWTGEGWKGTGVGGLVGAVTQGHAWWHLFTGLGCSRITIGTTCEFNFGLLDDLGSDGVIRFDVVEEASGAV
jgi:hypothetical protein